MKIFSLVDGKQTVTVERLDEHIHSHDIEGSFRIKKPTILLNFLGPEAVKTMQRPIYTMHFVEQVHCIVQHIWSKLAVLL